MYQRQDLSMSYVSGSHEFTFWKDLSSEKSEPIVSMFNIYPAGVGE